ncbi:MAG: hypothetical protein EOR73_14215 [Mesorhizobium sp.]|nr:MAG: hypothetical protein EOR73_14215 [Mesorhizobium sp.]
MRTAEAVHLWKYQGQRRADAAIRRSPSVLAIKGPRAPSPTSSTPFASSWQEQTFAGTFGRIAERTISKNIDVQPRLETRPGYRLNIPVDQDIVFREPTNRES